jgi:phage antirepressor YoqD-like protein
MKIHQLFKDKVSDDVLAKLLDAFGLKDINDDTVFTKQDLVTYKTVDKVLAISEQLEQFYLPCKAKIYLDDITESKCITVLRQVLKLFQVKLISKQKYINQKKCTIYMIQKQVDTNTFTVKVDQNQHQLTFN